MTKCLQDTIRVSENIARYLGINCPTRVLHIDKTPALADKIRNALTIVPGTSYEIKTSCDELRAKQLVELDYFDAILANEKLPFLENLELREDYPVILVPQHVYKFQRWKLAYTLHDLIAAVLSDSQRSGQINSSLVSGH